MLPAGEIIGMICNETKKPEEEIKKLVEEKVAELSGLVSEDGAAYIVARELGLNLLASTRRQLKVANLVPGLMSVDLVARVTRIFPPREFSRNGRQGVVQNVELADETGRLRLSLWNDETRLVSEGKIKEDDAIRIERGFTKQDNRGAPEMRIGKGSVTVVHEEIELPKPGVSAGPGAIAPRMDISQLKEGVNAELRACIIQVYRRNPFYEVCPQCERRVQEQDRRWKCNEHGEVEPKLAMVVAGVIDDGYGSIRAAFFRDMAERAFGKKVDELRELMTKAADPLSIYDHFQNIGRDMILRGRAKKSAISESLEFIVNDMEDADPKKECEALIKELGGG